MIISATAQGGFSGQSEHYRIDTRQHAQGQALEATLASSRFFAAQPAAAPVGADLQYWTITVDDNGQRHSISFAEGEPGAQPWQQLLQQIRAAR